MDKATVLGNLNPDDVRLDTSGANFRSRVFSVRELLDMLNDGKLDFICGRPFRRWTASRNARAVETLIMGLPPTSIILDGASGIWHVVDGAECLKAYLDFYNGKLTLKDSVILAEKTDRLTFDLLPQRLKERFLNAPVTGSILSSDCSFYDRLWVYSSTLTKQDFLHTSLWDCALWIRQDIAEALNSYAERIGAADAHVLWTIILGIAVSDRLADSNALFGNSTHITDVAEKMPFDIFECLTLTAVDKISQTISPSNSAQKYLQTMTQMVMSLNDFDGTPGKLNDKEICLGLALGYFYTRQYTLSRLNTARFIEAWTAGQAHLKEKSVKKYLAKTAEIIKIMSDDTHD